MGAPVRESRPHFEMPCILSYVHDSQVHTHVVRVPIVGARGHADALTRTHFRHASLNNGINRPWRVINCRCPPDMTVYSFVRRANVPNICGIPSVGLGLKSDAVFSTYFTHTHTRARTCVRISVRVRASILVQTNEKVLVLKFTNVVALLFYSFFNNCWTSDKFVKYEPYFI